jgi:hypothetical protein
MMTTTYPTPHYPRTSQWDPSPDGVVDWYDQWHTAVEWVETQPGIAPLSAAYLDHLTTLARWAGLGTDQTSMRTFLLGWLRQGQPASITALSRARRAERMARERGEGVDRGSD